MGDIADKGDIADEIDIVVGASRQSPAVQPNFDGLGPDTAKRSAQPDALFGGSGPYQDGIATSLDLVALLLVVVDLRNRLLAKPAELGAPRIEWPLVREDQMSTKIIEPDIIRVDDAVGGAARVLAALIEA